MTGFNAIESLARAGFLVKGVLYVVVGALAVQAAATTGGRITGTDGALTTVLRQPFGRTMVLVACFALVGYAAWRMLQAFYDPDGLGRDWRALATRASFVLRGAVYAGLGLQAFRLYRGLAASSGPTEREVAAEAFQWPLGDWLVVLAGVGLIGFAVQQVHAAVTCRFESNLDVGRLRRDAGEWAVGVARFGVAARAVVFALLGWAAIVAGWSRDASEVGTTASVLRMLGEQPGAVGGWLLGLIAAGLVAYGLYAMVHARYLHIRRV